LREAHTPFSFFFFFPYVFVSLYGSILYHGGMLFVNSYLDFVSVRRKTTLCFMQKATASSGHGFLSLDPLAYQHLKHLPSIFGLYSHFMFCFLSSETMAKW